MSENEAVATTTQKLEIENLRFTKDWTNPADFPAYESSEIQVRSDMQYLFNEIRTWLNEKLIPAVKTASEMCDFENSLHVKDVYVDAKGHLKIAMSDDTVDDLGSLRDDRIYVAGIKMPGDDKMILSLSDESTVVQGIQSSSIAETQAVLTSDRVRRYLAKDTSDEYCVRLQYGKVQVIRAYTYGNPVLHHSLDGRPLYWERDITDAPLNAAGFPEIGGEQVQYSTVETLYPVWVYGYIEDPEVECSLMQDPDETEESLIPAIRVGNGHAGAGNGYIYKNNNGLSVMYENIDGEKVSIRFPEDGGVKVAGGGDTGLRNVVTVYASMFDETANYGELGDIVAVLEDTTI